MDEVARFKAAVERVKERKLLLGTCLEEGAFLGVAGGAVRVALSGEHSFHKAMLEMKENREILNQELERQFGRGASIHCVVGGAEGAPNRIRAERAAEALAEAADEAESEAPEAPASMVRRIVDIFDGEILDPGARGSGAA
ncbi:MAG TPA: hypothetical protein VF363_00500 [Candidatus Eisenbacteria bacterium]